MDALELEKLRTDIEALRRSVRKANPFLRAVVVLRGYATLSIPIGILLVAYFLATHFMVAAKGSFGALSEAWKLGSWILIGAMTIAGSVGKWIIIRKRVSEIDSGAKLGSIFRAMYGGNGFHIYVPQALLMVGLPLLAFVSGHPWLSVSSGVLCLGLASNSMAMAVERREYLPTGWYGILSGLVSAFFIEGAPYLWSALVLGGIFLVFGFTTLGWHKGTER